MPAQITIEHLQKFAYIYIRQSSQHQVEHNTASQEVQRNLKDRALSLGWSEKKIKIIDEDLGVSASSPDIRTGFQTLVHDMCDNLTGALFFQYASRLARNGKEWNHALEVATIFNVLIIDRNRVYDPSSPNDRLMLGMQGVFSEYEVNQMQIRAREAINLKASQGKLFLNIPPAYVRTEDSRLEKTADERIRQSIESIFTNFNKFGSVNKTFNWYYKNNIELPVRDGKTTAWRIPCYKTLYNILTNSIYAGIYQYPKTKTIKRVKDGKIVKLFKQAVTETDNPVIYHNHFDGYISEEQYEKNQQIIANNCMKKTKDLTNGAPREGESILAGLLRCCHCSRTLQVRYNKSKRQKQKYHYYFCTHVHEFPDTKEKGRLSFSGTKLEQIISTEIIKVVQPHAIEAAIAAEEKYNQVENEKLSYLLNSIKQARYEADRIERQFNKVEPENRLVASTLEKRWQKALEKLEQFQRQYDDLKSQQRQLTDAERNQLFELANDLSRVWNDRKCDYREKTRLVRTLIEEIWLERLTPTRLKAVIHWYGGVHTSYEFPRQSHFKNKKQERQGTVITADIIKQLAKTCDDEQIVRVLNRAKYLPEKSATQISWTKMHIEQIRERNNIASFSAEKQSDVDVVNLQQASDILGVSMETVTHLIKAKVIEASQVIKYAPWQIEKNELTKPAVMHYIRSIQKGKKIALNKNQLDLL